MSYARVSSFALLLVVAGVMTLTLETEGLARRYYPRGYGRPTYQVPYRNDYHGYWRDQGYGYRVNRYGSRLPYRNDYHGYWHDQGYGYAHPPRYYGGYGYRGYGGYGYRGYGGFAPVYPNVKWHPRSKASYPR